AGPIRRRRRLRAATAGSHELFDDERSSQQLRVSADAAAARGDYATAVLERFRSVVRALDERAVLDDRPGMTAQEAAGLAGAALPAHAAGLQRAGRLFDDVRYGAAAPGPDEDEVMRDLAEQVATARTEPLRAEVP
ncbi:DUF4129 domain-containing protein, partial [Georgenia sp. 10Sc9-8]|nr:DUF4129 domain-containing protein [Georgenia halotolerans]